MAQLIAGASATVTCSTTTGTSSVGAGTGAGVLVTKSGAGTPRCYARGVFYCSPRSNVLVRSQSIAAIYRDIKLNSAAGVDSLTLTFYYTDAQVAATRTMSESAFRLFWWNGTAWQACSNQTLHMDPVSVEGVAYSGYLQAVVSSFTSPSLSQMTGTIFGLVPAVAPWVSMSPVSQTVAATTTAHILVNVGSADGGLFSSWLQVAPQPSGRYLMTGADLAFTPSVGDVGKTFSFSVTATSSLGLSSTGVVTVTVVAPPDTTGPQVTIDPLPTAVSSTNLTVHGFVQDPWVWRYLLSRSTATRLLCTQTEPSNGTSLLCRDPTPLSLRPSIIVAMSRIRNTR